MHALPHERSGLRRARRKPNWRIGVLIMGLALVAAAVPLAFSLMSAHEKTPAARTEMVKEYLQPFPLPPLSGTLPTDAPYRAGIEAYRRGDYARAATLFGEISGQPEHWPGVLFYRGLSQLYAGQPAAAAASFRDHLRRQANSATARWYLALALVSSGREKEAKRELEAVAAGPGTEYAAEAKALLAKLE